MKRSRIGRGSALHGKIAGDGELELLGEFEGSLDFDGALVIGEGARAEAEGRVRKLEIRGEVRGKIAASEAVHVRSGGVWSGEGSAPILSTEAGARLDGRFRVRPEEGAADRDRPE